MHFLVFFSFGCSIHTSKEVGIHPKADTAHVSLKTESEVPMQGVEVAHLNAAIKAGLKATYDFWNSTVEEALRPVSKYGKKDTLGMDAGPEITICEALAQYDSGGVVVTEEIGSREEKHREDLFRVGNPNTFRTVWVSDPTDRSNQLKLFLNGGPKDRRIGDILNEADSIKRWENDFGSPAVITGACSAISCIRRGVPIFSVIVNYITRHLVVSCAAGNRILVLPPERPELVDLQYVRERGELLDFPGIDGDTESMRRFVTFLGDVGKVGYKENFDDSGLMGAEEMKKHLHYALPGGPARVLYLSSLQPKDKRIGFILANGEKIGEWAHWLSFLQFAKSQTDESQPALRLYEVYQDRPWTKEGILMSTPPNYSIFREHDSEMHMDIGQLLTMSNPSQFRSTLIMSPYDNRWAVRSGSQSGYRGIRF
ncbi:MAG: hypothetical protein PHS53_04270 [Candidatus Pacebacteria bacterium]|nr:hypothetical protein [Candidatus Paceibacterota bacterium]MDD5357334.1 hypothetical protein [Candidatus Paceibacterota bacterium]